jgi:hypothetical protein
MGEGRSAAEVAAEAEEEGEGAAVSSFLQPHSVDPTSADPARREAIETPKKSLDA